MKTDSDKRQSVMTSTGTKSDTAESKPLPCCVFTPGNLPPGWKREELHQEQNYRSRLMRKTIKTVIELDEFNNTEIIELSKIMHEQGGKAEG